MAKKRKRGPKPHRSRVPSPASQDHDQSARKGVATDSTGHPPPRNAALDTLRGLAVALMLIDHVASYWFHVRIELTSVRFATRLSMPLFCVLLGYFLPRVWDFRFRRWGQILAAAVAVNLVYWPLNGELEILASLLAAAVVGTALGPAAPIMMLSILAYQVDPIMGWFDYQLSLVFALVAQGVVLRRFGTPPAIATGAALLAITVSGGWVYPTDTHRFLVWFLLPATGMVAAATRFPAWRVSGLNWLGRHPLTIYVAHFYVIAAVAAALR